MAAGNQQKHLEFTFSSLVPRRFRLSHSWTLVRAVTSPRDTHRECLANIARSNMVAFSVRLLQLQQVAENPFLEKEEFLFACVGFYSLCNVYLSTKVRVSNRKTAHLSSAFLRFSRNTDIEDPDGCLDSAIKFLTAKIVYIKLLVYVR